MTEAEWMACADPGPMLTFLRGKASDRKLRLFAVACCRRIWHLIADERSRTQVLVAERYADGGISKRELRQASSDAIGTMFDANTPTGVDVAYAANWASRDASQFLNDPFHRYAAMAATHCAAAVSWYSRQPVPGPLPRLEEVASWSPAENSAQASILRCMFGNPIQPVTAESGWLTANVLDLARTIYDERAFERLPIQADALMDAGCDNADILDHCRSEGAHVRGCWVVDLILGKS